MVYDLRELIKQRKTIVQCPFISDNFFKWIILTVILENLTFDVSLIEKKNSDSFRPVSPHFDHNDPQEKPVSFSIISTNFKGSNAVQSNDNT